MGSIPSKYGPEYGRMDTRTPVERDTHASGFGARAGLVRPLAEKPLAGARIELQLEGQLNVVCQRVAHVILEGVVKHGEDALRRDRVGGVGEHGAEHIREGRHLALVGAPEAEQCEGVVALYVA